MCFNEISNETESFTAKNFGNFGNQKQTYKFISKSQPKSNATALKTGK